MNRNALLIITVAGALSVCSTAQAQVAGTLGAPLVGAGTTVTAISGVHHTVPAQIVNGVVPAAEPTTTGVTHAIGTAGFGVTGTGQQVSENGLTVTGTSGGRPLVSVGATSPSNQGSIAAIANQ